MFLIKGIGDGAKKTKRLTGIQVLTKEKESTAVS